MEQNAPEQGPVSLDNLRGEINQNQKIAETVKLFISHSSRDKELMDALTDLLKTAFRLAAKDILCTSVPGHKLTGGADTEEELREFLETSQLLIGVLTPASLSSSYVLFELGARWGLKKSHIPLIACGAAMCDVKEPLSAKNVLNASNEDDIHQLIDDVEKQIGILKEPSAAYNAKIRQLVSTAKAQNTETNPYLRWKLFFFFIVALVGFACTYLLFFTPIITYYRLTTEAQHELKVDLPAFQKYLRQLEFRVIPSVTLESINDHEGDVSCVKGKDLKDCFLRIGQRYKGPFDILGRQYSHQVLKAEHSLAIASSKDAQKWMLEGIESGLASYFPFSFMGKMEDHFVVSSKSLNELKSSNDLSHAEGIWCSLLWELRSRVGSNITDSIVKNAWDDLNSLPSGDNPTKKFIRSIRFGVLQNARASVADVESILQRRAKGIGSALAIE